MKSKFLREYIVQDVRMSFDKILPRLRAVRNSYCWSRDPFQGHIFTRGCTSPFRWRTQSYLQLHQFAYFRRDTVSSVGVIRAGSLPLTDSADHVCFFHRAVTLDERQVKFLPEYVHGVVYKKDPAPERPGKQPTSFSFMYDDDRRVRSANSWNWFKPLSAHQGNLVSGNI